MRDFRDAKVMAQTLREALKTRSVSLTHSESLELVAKILGCHDWNVLAARIQAEGGPPAAKPEAILPATAAPLVAPAGHLPIVALRDLVFFPQMITPIFCGRDKSKQALECAMAADQRVLVVTQRRAGDDDPTAADLYGVDVIATIVELLRLGDRTMKVLAKGIERAAIVHLAEGPFLSAEIAPLKELRGNDAEALALSRTVLERLRALQRSDFLSSPNDRWSFLESSPYNRPSFAEEPATLADNVAPRLKCAIPQKQELLEAGDVIVRLQRILALMDADRQAA